MLLLPLLLVPLLIWNNNWDNGEERTLEFGDRDPDDDAVEFTGIGEAEITGDGYLVLTGDAPRYRVLDPKFENVNITFSAKRIDEDRDLSYQGFTIGARSQHETDDKCPVNTYYGRLTYDGRVSFEKELFHNEGTVAIYPPPSEQITLFEDGVPENRWFDISFIVRTINNGTSVLLQFYLDHELVLEYEDRGNWYVNAEEGICDNYPHNKIILSPGFTFIRNDGLGEAQYRGLTIQGLD